MKRALQTPSRPTQMRFKLQIKRKFLVLAHVLCALLCGITQQATALTRPIDRDARTLYYYNQPPNARGDYHYEFQTSNGITTKAAGNENGSSGVVQYISLEGIPITLTYVADADGYHPSGDHIPEIPDYVRASLEYIRTHAAVDEKKSRHL